MAEATKARTLAAIGERYPRTVALRDGGEIELRLMTAADHEIVLGFARSLPPDDLLFLRTNITDPARVTDWIAEIEAGRTITVLACDGGTVVGEGDLRYNATDWRRHIGEIRMLLSPAWRGKGVGRILADEIYALAGALELQMLTAQMTLDQAAAQAIFRHLGFQREAVLWDYVIDADGNKHDLLIATRRL